MHSVTSFDSSSEYLLTCIRSIWKTGVFIMDVNPLNGMTMITEHTHTNTQCVRARVCVCKANQLCTMRV